MDARFRWNPFKLGVAMIWVILCIFQFEQSCCCSLNDEGSALVDNNHGMNNMPVEVLNLEECSESSVYEQHINYAASRDCCNSQSSSRNMVQSGNIAQRRLMQVTGSLHPTNAERDSLAQRTSETPLPSPSPSPSLSRHLLSPALSPFSSISITPSASISSRQESPSPSPSELISPSMSPLLPPTPFSPPVKSPAHHYPRHTHRAPLPSPASAPSQTATNTSKSKNRLPFILSGVIGVTVLAFTIGFVYCRSNRLVSVKPWGTALSGQLQRAFVAGVPKLQRSELVTACEDFSNIIGSLSEGTIYKGTLSSGVEIAVASSAIKSAEDWSMDLEVQFRNKIDILSKVNHKNLLNLIGYCEEEEPFTRMMVFEYAPNGTLYEHLHIKESEHLDWRTRLRIAMGMAYCLEYMYELTPPIILKDLQSSSVYLTEDYAAKIADFSFWNEVTATKIGAANVELLEIPSADQEGNVYNFGMILLEMITARLPLSVEDRAPEDCALVSLREDQTVRDIVDPTLTWFEEAEVKKLLEVIKDCILPDTKRRPKMREVAIKLKDITALGPEGASPKSSPLLWAELEILSTESG